MPRLVAVRADDRLVPAIQSCLEGALDYFLETEGHPPSPDLASELVADAEADDSRKVFALLPRTIGPGNSSTLGTKDSSVLGVLDLHLNYPEPGVAHVGLLLFPEPWRGRGYGRETTAALERALAHEGFHELRLSVVEENAGARIFWERLGFAEVGRLDRGVSVLAKPL
jgi:RimJ/RimL family protein N-acetyltransferase